MGTAHQEGHAGKLSLDSRCFLDGLMLMNTVAVFLLQIYSMYPNTTSLYPATVVDSTTYCRDDDDIIVVEFDGEEPDQTGMIPTYHIPARFVTLIPREFPSSQPPAKNNKRKSTSSVQGSASKQKKTDDFLNFDFDGNFDSLDLDFADDTGFSLM